MPPKHIPDGGRVGSQVRGLVPHRPHLVEGVHREEAEVAELGGVLSQKGAPDFLGEGVRHVEQTLGWQFSDIYDSLAVDAEIESHTSTAMYWQCI